MIENGGDMFTDPQRPSVNRAVHYVSAGSADGKYPSVCRAAHITEVAPDTDPVPESGVPHVGLAVLNPTGLHFRPLAEGGVLYDENNAPYTWHWPERV
jgi:hypothetical protein